MPRGVERFELSLIFLYATIIKLRLIPDAKPVRLCCYRNVLTTLNLSLYFTTRQLFRFSSVLYEFSIIRKRLLRRVFFYSLHLIQLNILKVIMRGIIVRGNRRTLIQRFPRTAIPRTRNNEYAHNIYERPKKKNIYYEIRTQDYKSAKILSKQYF